MNDIEYSHGLMREKFIQRDEQAVQGVNNRHMWGGPIPIEERLMFVEQRLGDICGVVMKLLEELQKEKNGKEQEK